MGTYYPDSYGFFTAERSKRGAAYVFLRNAIRFPYWLRYGDVAFEPPTPGQNRVLDIGSGAGLQLEELTALGWDPWGVEPKADLARRTAERLGLPEDRILPGTAEDADFPEQSFELVTMSHVLEHVHDPRSVLEDVSRWLVPNGRLRLWLPDFGSLEARGFGRLWQGLDLPRHLYHFSKETLAALLRETGFSIERAIPQCQGNMLTGSVTYAVDALRRRAPVYREPRALHYALLPVASTLLALGEGGCLDVTARKHTSDDLAATA